MPKGQSNESETLDEKIKRIRKKNEEIEKRRLEVEADKQTAAKSNALVQLSAPKEDWPPPRPYICDDDPARTVVSTQEKSRERNKGSLTVDNSIYEGKRPPPDPAYKFLADAERDPLPYQNTGRYQQISHGRSHGPSRGRGRGTKTNVRDNTSLNERETPDYEAWRAERNRIDEERIRRQRTPQGHWRREWDNQKLEDDWQASHDDSRRESNPAQNRLTTPNVQNDSSQRKFVPRNTNYEEGPKRNVGDNGKKFGRNTYMPTDLLGEPLQKNITNIRSSDEEKKPETIIRKSAEEKTSSVTGQPVKSALTWSESRSIANSGNTLHVSFVNDPINQKATPPGASRKRVAGSGRVGVPPTAPRRGESGLVPLAGAEGGDARVKALPQRRIREARPRRRVPAAPRKPSTDDSWEDADDHSEDDENARSGTVPPEVAAVNLAGEPSEGEDAHLVSLPSKNVMSNPTDLAGEQLGDVGNVLPWDSPQKDAKVESTDLAGEVLLQDSRLSTSKNGVEYSGVVSYTLGNPSFSSTEEYSNIQVSGGSRGEDRYTESERSLSTAENNIVSSSSGNCCMTPSENCLFLAEIKSLPLNDSMLKSESSVVRSNTENRTHQLLAECSKAPGPKVSDICHFKKAVEVKIEDNEDGGVGVAEKYAQENTESGVYPSSFSSEVSDSTCATSIATLNDDSFGCNVKQYITDEIATKEIITSHTPADTTTTEQEEIVENHVTSLQQNTAEGFSKEIQNSTIETAIPADSNTMDFQCLKDAVFEGITEKDDTAGILEQPEFAADKTPDKMSFNKTLDLKESACSNTVSSPGKQTCDNSKVVISNNETKSEPCSKHSENSQERIACFEKNGVDSEAEKSKLESDTIQANSISNGSASGLVISPESKENTSVTIEEQVCESSGSTSEKGELC